MHIWAHARVLSSRALTKVLLIPPNSTVGLSVMVRESLLIGNRKAAFT